MMQHCSYVQILIPARLQSSRLLGKLLLKDGEGVEILARVYRTAIKVQEELRRRDIYSDLKVLCPAEEKDQIGAVIRKNDYGLPAPIYSSPRPFGNGTLRIAGYLVDDGLAVKGSNLQNNVIIHIQADEPELEAEDILTTLWEFLQCPVTDVQTLVTRLNETENRNWHCVKVLTSENRFAHRFTRLVVPGGFKHVGLYIYRPHYPLWYQNLFPAPNEEDLEQNRAHLRGARFRVTLSDKMIRGINTMEDYNEFLGRSAKKGSAGEKSGEHQQTSGTPEKDGDAGKPE